MIEKVVSAEGFSLCCEVSGQGGTLLLGLHGGPGGDGCAYMDPLHRLAGAGRRVVTFDQLGTARSEVPAEPYPWSIERAVADVDAVRTHFGAERVDLLGHSWGGMLALQYTLDHPERVGRLVLSNTTPSTARITTEFLRQVLGLLPPREAAAALTADALGDHDDPAFVSAVTRWLAAYSTNFQDTEQMSAEALAPGPAGEGLWGDRLWFATTALRGWDVEARLPEIVAPTLAVHGGHDMSSREINQVLADGIPDCEWLTLNRNGHGMFDEPNVDVYLTIVDSFLKRWTR
ncbi:alpha/beta fold hydrolase [Sphaerisporangium sp. NPDC051011]|uniref:alpha/beta fold hydrolase n=1 Tax=Sphaerisporangium sp. NPDC051011 TaxID=3155792 RepID=UPI003408706B